MKVFFNKSILYNNCFCINWPIGSRHRIEKSENIKNLLKGIFGSIVIKDTNRNFHFNFIDKEDLSYFILWSSDGLEI